MQLCKRHVWICMNMGQHGYSVALLNPWCPVPSMSHGELWKYHGALWEPHGVPWCTGSHPWCAMENLWFPMESPWCSMENERDTMEYFCKRLYRIFPSHRGYSFSLKVCMNSPARFCIKTVEKPLMECLDE